MPNFRGFAQSSGLHRILALTCSLIFTLIFAGYHLFAASYDQGSLLKRLDFLLYDWRYNLTLNEARLPLARDPIVIIDIDERSLGIEGRWPWSRNKLADLTHRLADAGVAVLGFDIILSEPEPNPARVLQLQALASDLPDLARQLEILVSLNDGDQNLANSFGGLDVVLSFLFHDDASIEVGQLPSPVYSLSSEQAGRLLAVTGKGYTGALPVLQSNAVNAGLIVPSVDSDGVIRSAPLVSLYGTDLYPSLALAMAMTYYLIEQVEPGITSYQFGLEGFTHINFADHRLGTDNRGRVLIPYRGPQGQFTYISATDILQGQFDGDSLENALVLVGTSSVGLSDLRTTPMGTEFPGVEIHANLLNGLLTGQFPYTPDIAHTMTAALLILLGLAYSLLSGRFGPLGLTLATLTLLVTLFGINFYFWVVENVALPLASSIFLPLALGGLNLLSGFLAERKSKQHVTDVFGQYVPKAHIEKMLNDPDAYGFEGENREMTVLFSDIRSFTTLSESLSATELKDLLNRYFTPITEVIFRHQGTIDKYVGDLVMAFWGAPLEDPQHAEHALDAAQAMIDALDVLNPTLIQQGYPAIEVGIGLNSGSMNVGDMGSEFRRAYTVLGDSVNLASRLEGLTKYYGAKILVGSETKKQCPNWLFRPVDRIRVKGKHEPVVVYEPVQRISDVTSQWRLELEQYEQAYQEYLNQNWPAANSLFTQLAKTSPRPTLYQIYLERIASMKDNPPPPDWDGTFTHTSK